MISLLKKIITILLIITFIIILNNINYNIKNQTYITDNKEIYYPIFNNRYIDNYIDKYLNSKIDKYNNYNIYIDYDYYKENNNIMLTFYEKAYHNNKEINNTKTYKINPKKSKIQQVTIKQEENNINIKNRSNSYKLIAFTFDDGPNHNTVKIIDTLKKYNMSATFFVLGTKAQQNTKIIKYMQENKMEIGNHTYSHRLLTNATFEQIEQEVLKTNQIIYNITNKYPQLIRPSYGSFNKKIRKNINMPIIIWNVDTLDWKNHSSKKIANKILKQVKDGDIILMHDIYSATAKAVEIVIPKLIEKGYKIVSVSELFYYKNIELIKGIVYGNAR